MYKLIKQLTDDDFRVEFLKIYGWDYVMVTKVVSRRYFRALQVIPKLSGKKGAKETTAAAAANVGKQIQNAYGEC